MRFRELLAKLLPAWLNITLRAVHKNTVILFNGLTESLHDLQGYKA